MKIDMRITSLLLRLSLAATFLSAVASRLSLWGAESSGWKNFMAYTAEVNSFAPVSVIPFLAMASTLLETSLAFMLALGYQTKRAGAGAGVLTLLFSLAMTYSFGIKSSFDYSVFVVSASSFLLASLPEHQWSLDNYLSNRLFKTREYAS